MRPVLGLYAHIHPSKWQDSKEIEGRGYNNNSNAYKNAQNGVYYRCQCTGYISINGRKVGREAAGYGSRGRGREVRDGGAKNAI